MRLSKSLLLLALLIVVVAPGVSQAQGVDSVFISNVSVDTGDTVDVLVRVKNTFDVAGMTIPLHYSGTGVTLIAGTAEPRAAGAIFAIFSELIDVGAQTALYGFISFAGPMVAGDGDVLRLKFTTALNSGQQEIIIDTMFIGPANVLALEADTGTVTPTEFVSGSIDTRITGIGDGLKPLAFALKQNYPNPFNADTKISFALPKADMVKLRVFNVLGQQVTTLVDGVLEADQHDIIWDGTNAQGTAVASGTYFYRLEIGDTYEKTLRMTLLK